MKQTSKIAASTAEILMAVFAGQTVTLEQVLTEVTAQYAYANKRTGFMSYSQVMDAIERAGATHRYTGANYTGTCLYTFPAAVAA